MSAGVDTGAGAGDRNELLFDGESVPFHDGQTIGAALMAQGIVSWRSTRREGAPRGLFCGIGVCFDCLVTVDDRRSERACITSARAGQVVCSDDPTAPLARKDDDRV
jgi:hypothetical protein